MPRAQASSSNKSNKRWQPPPKEGDEPFAEIDLNASKGGVERVTITPPLSDEALPGGEDDEGDEPTGRKSRYSDPRSVSRRIGRLERTFNQRMADAEARHQRELADVRREADSLRVSRSSSDVDETAHNTKIAALQADLAQAFETGNTARQADLTTQIARLQGEFESRKRDALLGRQQPTAQQQPAREARRPDNREGGPTPEARRWMRKNEWWDDPEFAIERDAAVRFDNELMDEGSDPNDPEHYEELCERLLEKFPDMKDEIVMPGRSRQDRRRRARDDEGDEDDEDEDRGTSRRRSGRPPIPAFNTRDGERAQQLRSSGNGRKATLSRAQRENMITFGLDPDNDDHCREYAKSSEETERAYGGRR